MGRPGVRFNPRRLAATLLVVWCGVVPSASAGTGIDDLKALLKADKFAEAETGARALLAETEAQSGADSVEAARVLDVLVESLRRGDHDYDPAWRTMAERAIAIKERVLGPEDPEVATSLNGLGALLFTIRDFVAVEAYVDTFPKPTGREAWAQSYQEAATVVGTQRRPDGAGPDGGVMRPRDALLHRDSS